MTTKIIGLTWLAMIGWDFFLHAGLMATWYVEPSPFLLSPQDAFVRIPIGYLSFLLLAILLVWILRQIETKSWKNGCRIGFLTGALIWGSFTLGIYSIATASPGLLIGWFLGQTVSMGIAGIVAGAALSGHSLGRLFLKTLGFVVLSFVVTISLQIAGLAPAIK